MARVAGGRIDSRLRRAHGGSEGLARLMAMRVLTGPARRRRRAMLACVSAFAGVVVVIVARPVPASAHTELVASVPRDGAVLAEPPASARLTFGEVLGSTTARVALSRDGAVTSLPADPVVSGNEVLQQLPASVPVGKWVLAYRVVSQDGHPVSGQITFYIGTRPADTPSSAPRKSSDARTSFRIILLVPIGIALLALAGLTYYVLRGSRRQRHDPDDGADADP